jgi:transcription initiation factor TFIIIB Brf1 subunit/transcription initiation factor TFIIB
VGEDVVSVVCDKCDAPIASTDQYSVEDEYGEVVCLDCRILRDEAAYDRQQEKNFTDYWEGE